MLIVAAEKAKLAGDACSDGAVAKSENVTEYRGRVTSGNVDRRWVGRDVFVCRSTSYCRARWRYSDH